MTNQPTKLQQIASGNTTASPTATKPTVTATAPAVAKVGHNETASIKGAILSVVKSLEIQDEERDAQKEILAKLKSEHGIDAKVAKKVAKMIHKNNSEEIDEENDAVDKLYARLKS